MYRTAQNTRFPVTHITIERFRGWDAQNNVMSKAQKISELCPTLPYLELAKHELSVQIWIFIHFLAKHFWGKLISTSTPRRDSGLANMTFLDTLHSIYSKK